MAPDLPTLTSHTLPSSLAAYVVVRSQQRLLLLHLLLPLSLRRQLRQQVVQHAQLQVAVEGYLGGQLGLASQQLGGDFVVGCYCQQVAVGLQDLPLVLRGALLAGWGKRAGGVVGVACGWQLAGGKRSKEATV